MSERWQTIEEAVARSKRLRKDVLIWIFAAALWGSAVWLAFDMNGGRID